MNHQPYETWLFSQEELETYLPMQFSIIENASEIISKRGDDGYYYITEPEEDSLNKTFMLVAAICAILVAFSIGFTIFMMGGGEDLLFD